MTTHYVPFDPARRPEEYVGQPGPHNGLALEHNVLEAIAEAKVTGKSHGFLVRGEWRRSDGLRFLDIAVDRAWVMSVDPNYQLVDGRLRWVCPECGHMSSNHRKGCGHR